MKISIFRSALRCSLMSGVLAAATICFASSILTQSFDGYPIGPIVGNQGGLSSCLDASIEDVSGRGRVLSLAYPRGSAKVPVNGAAGIDHLDVRFGAGFAPTLYEGTRSTQKLYVTLLDASGRRIAHVYHDGDGQWGVAFGTDNMRTIIPQSRTEWYDVDIRLDQVRHRFDLRLTIGDQTYTVLSKGNFVDASAGPLSSVVFARNEQGGPGACSIEKIVVAEAPAVSTDRLDAWLDGAPRLNIASAGSRVRLHLEALSADNAPDTLDWVVRDYTGATMTKGSVGMNFTKGKWTSSLELGSLKSGYYSLSGKMRRKGLVFTGAGSRPDNLVSFGVMPSIAAIPLKHADDSRFGMNGNNFTVSGKPGVGDPFDPLYRLIGVHWVCLGARWSDLEPDHAGAFQPADHAPAWPEVGYACQDRMARLNYTEGIPHWAMAVPQSVPKETAAKLDVQSYPPSNLDQFEDLNFRVGKWYASIMNDSCPWMVHNWYQLSWEPDWHWQGTPQEYVAMCQHASAGLHRGDPSAMVLAPGAGVIPRTLNWLRTMLPMGLGKALDGVATHAYYPDDQNPRCKQMAPGEIVAPEDYRQIEYTRELRSLVRKYLKPGAPIIVTEWGIGYERSYAFADAEALRQIAACLVRGHIILLGEGVKTTFFFYSSDYISEPGFGLTFNLTMPDPNWGAISVAPKPAFMACAAMTRVLDGTTTLGPLSALPPDVYAYAFDRAGQTVVAVWKPHGASAAVRIPVCSKATRLVDFMGNERTVNTPTDMLTVQACEYPVYIFGARSSALHLAK
ncbi:MAG: hypothetical protein P4L33_13095 [Capsulimonadaceae bacterium]|nr:hypothetical protein [Capsulimonadaceae bacterium]